MFNKRCLYGKERTVLNGWSRLESQLLSPEGSQARRFLDVWLEPPSGGVKAGRESLTVLLVSSLNVSGDLSVTGTKAVHR